LDSNSKVEKYKNVHHHYYLLAHINTELCEHKDYYKKTKDY